MTEERRPKRRPRRSQLIAGVSLLAMAAVMLLSSAGSPPAEAQASAKITVSPSKTQVAPGETFTVSIRQDVAESVLSAQGNLYFDASLVHVVAIEPGPDYADAQFFLGDSVKGVAPTADEAIATGNSSGILANIAVFYLPGTGSVPSGDREVVKVTMQAVMTGAGGTSPLKFDSRQVVVADPIGNTESLRTQGVGFLTEANPGELLPAATQASQVTVVAGATAAPTDTPSASGSVTPTRTRRPISTGDATPNPSLAAAITMSVTPDSVDIKSGESATATIDVDSPIALTGGQLTLKFDNDKVKVAAIEPGDKWEVSGTSSYASQIAEANSSGTLSGLSILQKATADPVPAGKTTLFSITFEPVSGDGKSDLELSNGSVIDEDGNDIQIGVVAGAAIDESGGGGSSTAGILLIVGGLLGMGVLGGGGFLTWRNTRRNRWEE